MIRFILMACVAVLLTTASAGNAEESRDLFGVWCSYRGIRDPSQLRQKCPWLKGTLVQLKWNQLEPQDNKFDWAYFDGAIEKWSQAGFFIMFQVWAGPASPEWLYEAGVPTVKTTGKGNSSKRPHDTFPYYLDPYYKDAYHRMIRAVAAHVDSLSPSVREKIICIQSAEGSTGDQGSYKGKPLDDKFILSEKDWNQFKRETWLLLDELYRDKQPQIQVLITVTSREDINEGNSGWLLEHLPHVWRKATGPCQMYQMRDELIRLKCGDPLYNDLDVSGHVRTRCRGELSLSDAPWFQEAPTWNMYWLNLWVLHFGVDMFMQRASLGEDPRYTEAFQFFSRYAGRKDPTTAPGAWCALRDGLDASDHDRFPDNRFGPDSDSKQRAVRIAEAFASQGAHQGDPDGLAERANPKALNDVGVRIWAGNYGRFLVQYDPNGTSRGCWRVGPKDQPYGRFARAFDTKAGKNTMFFDIVDRFFGGAPLNGAAPVNVRVVYFDKGTGTWSLRYDAVAGTKTAVTVTKTDTNRWKETTVEVSDGYFGNRCPHHTDLMLVGDGQTDTQFHLIELTRR
jgi:hypothetical protein